MQTTLWNGCCVTPINELPEPVDLNFVKILLHALEAVARNGNGPQISSVLPEAVAAELVARATSIVADEGVIVYVHPPDTMSVNVHGDLHGHFFDLCHCLLSEGVLEGGKYCVFNGVPMPIHPLLSCVLFPFIGTSGTRRYATNWQRR